MFSFRRRVMRTLRVLTYIAVVCAVLGGASAFVVMAFQPPTVTLASLQEAPKVAPSVQASRNAVPVEKAKTAALVATDQATVDDVTPQATQNEGSQARAHRTGERSNREVRRRTDGYTRDARWSSNMPRLHGPE
jgi:hypothetical protein